MVSPHQKSFNEGGGYCTCTEEESARKGTLVAGGVLFSQSPQTPLHPVQSAGKQRSTYLPGSPAGGQPMPPRGDASRMRSTLLKVTHVFFIRHARVARS